MDPTVHLTFRYLESDTIKAMRVHYASHFHLRLSAALIVVLIAAGPYLWRSPGSQWFGAVSVTVAVLYGLMILYAFFVAPQLIFRREPKFRDEYSMAFSPEGIHFRTAHIDSQLQWSMYTKALIVTHSYLLYYGKYNFTLIPKRVFESVEQQEAFESLLKQHVPEIVRIE
jgi:hypothetical protein